MADGEGDDAGRVSRDSEGVFRARLRSRGPDRGEFHQFLGFARSSCGDVRSDLYVALDVGYINDTQFETYYAQAEEVARIVSGLRASVGRQRK